MSDVVQSQEPFSTVVTGRFLVGDEVRALRDEAAARQAAGEDITVFDLLRERVAETEMTVTVSNGYPQS